MLVVRSERLDKAHSRQRSVLQIQKEIVFVLEMSSGNGISLSIGKPGCEVIEKRERLMMPLEKWIDRCIRRCLTAIRRVAWRADERVVPAAGVPLPTHALFIQSVAYGWIERPRSISGIAIVE